MATYTSNYAWTKPEGSDPVDIGVLNNNLDSQDSIVHNAYMQFAPVFSAASTYAVDDVVLYANNLYKCITAVTVAGAWDPTKWTQVKVSDICGGGGGGGTSDYSQLTNKPSINSVTLSGNKTSADLGLQDAIQLATMPTASATYVGKVVQFVGTTDATYTHGYYYECANNGGTYTWTQLNVQPSSGGGEVKNLDNGMLSHSTDSSYITVNLDVALSAGKEYRITLRDPAYDYIDSTQIVWQTDVDVIFAGNGGGPYKIRLTQTTASLYNYSGTGWRNIYCDIISDFAVIDYDEAANKPSINNVTLVGNKSLNDLGINAAGVGLGNVPNVTTDDQTPTFTTAQSRNNLVSGEKISVMLGKISKFFNDLKTVAFTGSYVDLTNQPTIPSQAQDISYGSGTVEDALDGLDAHTISNDTKVGLTADTNYTTLSDGYFKISANSGNNYVIGRINGINMAVANGTSFGSGGQCCFFVRKGTVIQFAGTAGQCSGSFYPLQ